MANFAKKADRGWVKPFDFERYTKTVFYTNEAADAIELILETINPFCIHRSVYGFRKNNFKGVEDKGFCIRNIDGMIGVYPFGLADTDFARQNYLQKTFKRFLIENERQKFKIKQGSLVNGLGIELAKGYTKTNLEDALIICKEASPVWYAYDFDGYSERYKKLIGKPFDQFKISALDYFYKEYSRLLNETSLIDLEAQQKINEIAEKILDIFYTVKGDV